MNRAAALAWLNSSGFDGAMTDLGRVLTDSASGYGPVLDRAFALHAMTYDLAQPLTTVDTAYDFQFTVLLEACAADLMSRGLARMADINVDAPLMGLKMSQAYRQYNAMRERLWRDAAFYGYVITSNVGGFAINMDYIEPSGNDE